MTCTRACWKGVSARQPREPHQQRTLTSMRCHAPAALPLHTLPSPAALHALVPAGLPGCGQGVASQGHLPPARIMPPPPLRTGQKTPTSATNGTNGLLARRPWRTHALGTFYRPTCATGPLANKGGITIHTRSPPIGAPAPTTHSPEQQHKASSTARRARGTPKALIGPDRRWQRPLERACTHAAGPGTARWWGGWVRGGRRGGVLSSTHPTKGRSLCTGAAAAAGPMREGRKGLVGGGPAWRRGRERVLGRADACSQPPRPQLATPGLPQVQGASGWRQ